MCAHSCLLCKDNYQITKKGTRSTFLLLPSLKGSSFPPAESTVLAVTEQPPSAHFPL